jgi:hypothetical protein
VWIDTPAGDSGHVRFLAPQGEIEVRIPAGDHVADPAAIRVLPGGGNATLKARRCCGIRIALREDGTPVPVGLAFTVRAEPIDNEGSVVSTASDGTTLTLRVSRPGRYRLRFKDIAGYAPIGRPHGRAAKRAGRVVVRSRTLTSNESGRRPGSRRPPHRTRIMTASRARTPGRRAPPALQSSSPGGS